MWPFRASNPSLSASRLYKESHFEETESEFRSLSRKRPRQTNETDNLLLNLAYDANAALCEGRATVKDDIAYGKLCKRAVSCNQGIEGLFFYFLEKFSATDWRQQQQFDSVVSSILLALETAAWLHVHAYV